MVVDGVELLRMIRDNEIEEGTKIKMYYNYELIETLSLNHNDLKNEKTGNSIIDGVEYCIGVFASDMHKFKILEKEELIDIQAIEDIKDYEKEIDAYESLLNHENKINELIKAIKQLDKKIKE